ncbi:hypothetical protein NQ315_006722 [Exocentrus adspersus]|uniref:Uncharacterized protein n=1 Tax=Exocentrus adspersus TaxID=1586481 RepID=A0AAV8WCH3_9CUCU|nr:hypothetical protein NQ315_006722 [Exocentrus adspersus]
MSSRVGRMLPGTITGQREGTKGLDGGHRYCSELEPLPETARLMKILSCEKRENKGSLKRADGT